MKLIKYGMRGGPRTVTESEKGPRSYSMTPEHIAVDAGTDAEGRHYTLEMTRPEMRLMARQLIRHLGENMRQPHREWAGQEPREWEVELDNLLWQYDQFMEEHTK